MKGPKRGQAAAASPMYAAKRRRALGLGRDSGGGGCLCQADAIGCWEVGNLGPQIGRP